jgi:hypothetical protein
VANALVTWMHGFLPVMFSCVDRRLAIVQCPGGGSYQLFLRFVILEVNSDFNRPNDYGLNDNMKMKTFMRE